MTFALLYPWTHFLVGAALGKTVNQHSGWTMLVAGLAATLPDVPFLAQLAINIWRRLPNKREKNILWLDVLSNAAHSIPVWMTTAAICFVLRNSLPKIPIASLVYAFAIGGLSHAIADVFTHGYNGHFRGDLYLWPFGYNLGAKLGVCDYRTNGQWAWPKLFEKIIILAAIVLLF